jgi:chromosome segregation ATPase
LAIVVGAPAPPTSASVPEEHSNSSSAAELQAAKQKVVQLRQELSEASAKNLDLELDHANVSARVLELESEASLLKASLAEWRRKYSSLEQQLEVQERDFKRRLDDEKAALMESLRGEVAEQLKTIKSKWDAREQELLRAAGQLPA